VLDWTTARGYRTGDYPAALKILRHALPTRSQPVVHHPALPYREIPAFVEELAKLDDMGSRALRFTILTAARTGEVLDAAWSEIDLGERLWTIPARRMKGGREHRVPLSEAATAVLRECADRRENGYVFSGDRYRSRVGNNAMWRLVITLRPGFDVHGLRSSFRDWCSKKTSALF
jgi:integrase